MINLNAKILITIATILILAGCSTTKFIPETVEVKIPVPIACQATAPVEPVIACYTKEQNIFEAVKCLLYEVETRKAYEIEIKAALESCK